MFHTTKYGGKVYKLYKFHQSLSLGCWTSQAAIHIHKNRIYRAFEDTIQTVNLKTEPNTIILLDFVGLYSNTALKIGKEKAQKTWLNLYSIYGNYMYLLPILQKHEPNIR